MQYLYLQYVCMQYCTFIKYYKNKFLNLWVGLQRIFDYSCQRPRDPSSPIVSISPDLSTQCTDIVRSSNRLQLSTVLLHAAILRPYCTMAWKWTGVCERRGACRLHLISFTMLHKGRYAGNIMPAKQALMLAYFLCTHRNGIISKSRWQFIQCMLVLNNNFSVWFHIYTGKLYRKKANSGHDSTKSNATLLMRVLLLEP